MSAHPRHDHFMQAVPVHGAGTVRKHERIILPARCHAPHTSRDARPLPSPCLIRGGGFARSRAKL